MRTRMDANSEASHERNEWRNFVGRKRNEKAMDI